MNESLAQHSAQTPSPSTGSRQETHSVGSAMSSPSPAVCAHTPRAAFSTPRQWPEMERGGDVSASMEGEASAGVCDAQAESWNLASQKTSSPRNGFAVVAGGAATWPRLEGWAQFRFYL